MLVTEDRQAPQLSARPQQLLSPRLRHSCPRTARPRVPVRARPRPPQRGPPRQRPAPRAGAMRSEKESPIRVPGHGGFPPGREPRTPASKACSERPRERLAGGVSSSNRWPSVPWKEGSSPGPGSSTSSLARSPRVPERPYAASLSFSPCLAVDSFLSLSLERGWRTLVCFCPTSPRSCVWSPEKELPGVRP